LRTARPRCTEEILKPADGLEAGQVIECMTIPL
jgi:hypothetical protein